MYSTDTSLILARMKLNVPNDLNKEEGSIVHDSLTGASEELGQAYDNLNQIVNRVFIKKALENGYDEDVELKCNELGILRKNGVKARGKITFVGDEGTLISKDIRVQTKTGKKFITLNSDIVPESGLVEIEVEAVETGSFYNCPENTIVELESQIPGIVSITNKKEFSNGVDIESIQKLYERYLLRVTTPVTSGNEAHYKQWALEVPGVSDAEVISTWNGGGTVKVILLSDDKRKPSQDIIDNAFNHIEIYRPAGPVITVVGANEYFLNISVKVQLATNAEIEEVKSLFINGVNEYLKSIAFKDRLIRYTRIANVLMDIPPIIDYFDLVVNEATSNIEISKDTVALLGEVTLSAN